MLVEEGFTVLKFWLDVDRAEQLKRFLDREKDPLKQWKLSQIDIDGLAKWDDYSARRSTRRMAKTHFVYAPWTVILSDDKMRARIAAIQTILLRCRLQRPRPQGHRQIDPQICGMPSLRAK